MRNFVFAPPDCFLLFSNSGINEVVVDVALEAKRMDLPVIAVVSIDHCAQSAALHSSGKKLTDIADIVIDNCVPAEDALVSIEGWKAPVAAGSTLAFIAIAMAIVAQVASELARRGIQPPVFVSPNVPGISPDNNRQVFAAYERSRVR